MRRRKTPAEGYDFGSLASLRSIDELRAAREDLAEYGSSLAERAENGDQLPDGEIRTVTDHLSALDRRIEAAELRLAAFKDKATSGPTHGDEERALADEGHHTPARRNRDTEKALERGVVEGLISESAAPLLARAASESPAMDTYIRSTGTEAYESAFRKIVSSERGHLSLTDSERRAYQAVQTENRGLLESNTGNSLLLPYQLDPAIILSSGGSVNPMREIARSVTTTTNSWRGVTSAGVTAQWTPEASEVGDNTPALASPTIPVHKATAFVPFSYELEQDAEGLFPSDLQALLLDGVEQLEAQAFITGTGVNQPKGIITALAAASPSVLVAPAVPESVTAADVYNLTTALPPRFRPGARFALNLQVLNGLRQMETTNGALKFPELADGKLLSKPVSEISALDGTINPAATEANYAAVYGDFSQFVIVNKLGSVVELVPQLFGPNGRPTGQRGLLLHVRTGSDVVVPSAFRVLSVPTTA